MAQAVSIVPLPAWNGYVPEWLDDDGGIWLSRGPRVFHAAGLGKELTETGRVGLSPLASLIALSHYGRRLLRLSFYNLVPRDDGSLFIAFNKTLAVLHRDGSIVPVKGLQKSFRVLRGGVAKTDDGTIYFGEYVLNHERSDPINIYRLPRQGSTAEVVHTFGPGEVRHVHSVRWDSYGRCLWVCCGDRPSECRIMRTRDGFRTLETMGAGDESWRALQPVFTERSIFFANDAEFEANALFRLDRETFARGKVADIDGPSYYGATVPGGAAYATTVELCPSQKETSAVIWSVFDEQGTARPIARYSKDLFGLKVFVHLFQAGMVLFPAGTASNAVPFTGTGLSGLNERMFVLRVSR